MKRCYYAVIFTSTLKEADPQDEQYESMACEMEALASQQEGFLGIDSVRGAKGAGITVSYWTSRESIAVWKSHFRHKIAQKRGKTCWYSTYRVRIAKVKGEYGKD